jgi:hypothetical protein
MSKEYLYNFWLTVVAAPAATACSLARSASAAARFLHTHRQTNKRQKQQSKNEKKKNKTKLTCPRMTSLTVENLECQCQEVRFNARDFN